MNPLTTITCSLAIAGDDLAIVIVVTSPINAQVKRYPIVRRFLSLSAAERHRALADVPGSARIALTCPASWCALRPVPISTSSWPSARSEILRSIEGMFPIAAADALVGLIDCRAESGAESGYLVAADRTRLQPWLAAIESAVGRRIETVLSPHMALLGVGLQNHRSAIINEPHASGVTLSHRFDFGEVVELALPAQRGEDTSTVHVRTLSSGASDALSVTDANTVCTPTDLAVGAALAPKVAPRRFAPLVGAIPRGPRRALAPIAAALAIAATIWGALATESARFDSAARALRDQQDARHAQLARVESDRARTTQLVSLLDDHVAPTVARWHSILPDLLAAQHTLPDGAFAYRVELSPTSLTLRGEAARASDVLRRVEDAPQFTLARLVDAPVTVEERTTEQFRIRADRQSHPAPGANRAGSSGGPGGGGGA